MEITEIYSHTFFGKTFVKVTFFNSGDFTKYFTFRKSDLVVITEAFVNQGIIDVGD